MTTPNPETKALRTKYPFSEEMAVRFADYVKKAGYTPHFFKDKMTYIAADGYPIEPTIKFNFMNLTMIKPRPKTGEPHYGTVHKDGVTYICSCRPDPMDMQNDKLSRQNPTYFGANAYRMPECVKVALYWAIPDTLMQNAHDDLNKIPWKDGTYVTVKEL